MEACIVAFWEIGIDIDKVMVRGAQILIGRCVETAILTSGEDDLRCGPRTEIVCRMIE